MPAPAEPPPGTARPCGSAHRGRGRWAGAHARALGLRERAGQLEHGQWVAGAQLHDPVPHHGDDRQRAGAQQLVDRRHRQRPDQTRRETRQREPVAGREQHHHPVGSEAARGEPERVRGLPVQPLGVVDDAEHAARLRRLGQDGQHTGPHQEAVDRGGRAFGPTDVLAQRSAQCPGLTDRQRPEQVHHRPQKTVQTGERQVGLGLHALSGQDQEVRGPVDRIVQQRGLPDAGLSAQQQTSAPAGPHPGQQHVDRAPLRLPADQPSVVHPSPSAPPPRQIRCA